LSATAILALFQVLMANKRIILHFLHHIPTRDSADIDLVSDSILHRMLIVLCEETQQLTATAPLSSGR
jgi:hypothetical protein